MMEPPSRCGFAGVVNYVVAEFPDADGRLLLINPDAYVGPKEIEMLLAPSDALRVPKVVNPSGQVENIRAITTAGQQLRALLFGEWAARKAITKMAFNGTTVECPPFAPSGSVLSVPLDLLRSVPLREEYFWLEQSDWLLRYFEIFGPLKLEILPISATHTGASTSIRYPLSVAASQLNAKANFVRTYGTTIHRLLLPLAIFSRTFRFFLKNRQISDALFLGKVYAGKADWRVNK